MSRETGDKKVGEIDLTGHDNPDGSSRNEL
jgi:hypothetical protein